MKSDYTTTANKWLTLPDPVVAEYNALDCIITARLAVALQSTLEENNQYTFYRGWFDSMVPVVEAMRERGVGDLDRDARNAYRARLRKEIREVEAPILAEVKLFDRMEELAHTWHKEFVAENPTKPRRAELGLASRLKKVEKRRGSFFNRGGERNNSDLAVFLFDDLGLKPAPTTQKRPARSVAQEALIYILDHLRKKDEPHRWVLENLFHRSRLNTILTRYMTIEGDTDGRVRPTVKLYGTETLRLAYAGDRGEAIQQWPKEARHVIRARPGHLYVARDYRQLEVRISAYLSGDQAEIEVFESGADIHAHTAMDLLGLSEHDWNATPSDKRKRARNFAKQFRYGIGYGGQAETMNVQLFCPCPRCADKRPDTLSLGRDELRKAADRWAAKHKALLEWRESLVDEIKGHGGDHSWTSPWGYRRFFFEPRSKAERSIYNFPMQHGGSQIINRAMVRVHEEGAPLVLQMHDELVLEVPADHTARWHRQLKAAMEAPVPELGGVSFPTDESTGATWGDL